LWFWGGIHAGDIAVEVRNLCADCAAWIEQGVYPPDEVAARFHHRLTAIHPFPNGNGRHARLITDILLVHLLQQPRFTWGSGSLVDAGVCRKRYVDAVRAADRNEYEPLLFFVRS